MRKNISSLNVIGKEIVIVNSSNPYLIGLKGKVIYETKNMLTIKTDNGLKKIPKNVCLIRVFLNDNLYLDVNGKKIVGTLDRRIKR